MPDLRELYQQVVLEHTQRPRNFCVPGEVNREARGDNPFCGDSFTVYLKVEDGVITDVGFQGSGCAISTSSTSMMTQSIKGKSLSEVEKLFGLFHRMITRGVGEDFDAELLGDLEILSGIIKFPSRVKCASLSWHTLQAALRKQDVSVSTE
jgi:nitrogen fixation NifU-like protein